MLEVLLGWIGLGLYLACAFGAIAAGVRADEHSAPKPKPEPSREDLHA